jgi:hypothetical protein
MDKFGKCKEIAIEIADQIPNCEIVFGLYFPVTPKSKWDERWRNATFFTHFWVEFDDRIIDAAKEQFGEPFVSIIPQDDVRYVKIGVLNKHTDKVTPQVVEPQIKWETVDGNPLRFTHVIWAGYEDHMKIINQLRAN